MTGPPTQRDRRDRRPAAPASIETPLATLRSIVLPEPAPKSPALRIRTVTVTPCEGRCAVQVELDTAGDRALGLAEGPLLAMLTRRLVGEATLRALTMLDGRVAQAAVDAVVVGPVGDQTVVTVTIAIATASAEATYAGAAVVGAPGEYHAIVTAVLAAVTCGLGLPA
ncbi:MAG: hypothetical protein NVSMB12_20140 [Acidimicrobiales bacterium]